MNNIQRPALDRSLYEPSHLWAAAHFVYALALFFVPGYASYEVAMSELPLWAQIPAIAFLTIVAGYGLNLLGVIGHEGTHGNFVKNRRLSAVIGIFSASAVVSYMEMGFALSHWNHHRFTNQKDDPNVYPVENLKSWWSRLLMSRINYNLVYLKDTFSMAMGKIPTFKYKVAFTEADQILFARLNFLFAAMWIALYAAIFTIDWRAGLFVVALPTLAVKFIAACQIFIDHGGLDDDRLFRNSWSRTSPLMTILFFGANYHNEHHAYPGIPCYRLPQVHRILREKGVFEAVPMPVERGFFKSFKPLFQVYAPTAKGDDFDPFEIPQATTASDERGVPQAAAVAVGAVGSAR